MKQTERILTVLFVFAAMTFTSCSNDDSNNESFGTTTGDFLPLSVNNTWTYLDQDQSLLNEIQIIGTANFSGKKYYEFTDDSSEVDAQQYFAKKGATYFLKVGKTSFNVEGITATIASYEVPILKDDYNLNQQWTGSISPKLSFSGGGQSGTLPFDIEYTATNYFKGEVVLGGITYPNVIKTIINININANGEISNANEEYWFAENIGIINFITVNSDNSVTEKTIESYLLN